MKFTNRFGLPEILLRAAKKNDAKYNKGNVNRSVTQLIQSPRIDLLRKKHFSEMEKDMSDEWWALFGSAVHHVLEMGAVRNEKTEERFFTTIDGWSISGACDLQTDNPDNTVSLSDYKVTTAYALLSGDAGYKAEWEEQLNMLAYLVTVTTGKTVRDLSIVAIIRDWQKKQAQLDPDYPQAPVVPIKIPLWSKTKQHNFINERIDIHRAAEASLAIAGELPECSDYERWVRGDEWVVMKEGNKKATKRMDTEKEAIAYIEGIKKDQHKYSPVFRPGEPIRCKGNYCGVSAWCAQYAKWQEDNKDKTIEGEDNAE